MPHGDGGLASAPDLPADVVLPLFVHPFTRGQRRGGYDSAPMRTPHPDTSEYAALLDVVATGGRDRSSLKPGQDFDGLLQTVWRRRARATTQALLLMARLRDRRR